MNILRIDWEEKKTAYRDQDFKCGFWLLKRLSWYPRYGSIDQSRLKRKGNSDYFGKSSLHPKYTKCYHYWDLQVVMGKNYHDHAYKHILKASRTKCGYGGGIIGDSYAKKWLRKRI